MSFLTVHFTGASLSSDWILSDIKAENDPDSHNVTMQHMDIWYLHLYVDQHNRRNYSTKKT